MKLLLKLEIFKSMDIAHVRESAVMYRRGVFMVLMQWW
jgi:hypothetical protein